MKTMKKHLVIIASVVLVAILVIIPVAHAVPDPPQAYKDKMAAKELAEAGGAQDGIVEVFSPRLGTLWNFTVSGYQLVQDDEGNTDIVVNIKGTNVYGEDRKLSSLLIKMTQNDEELEVGTAVNPETGAVYGAALEDLPTVAPDATYEFTLSRQLIDDSPVTLDFGGYVAKGEEAQVFTFDVSDAS